VDSTHLIGLGGFHPFDRTGWDRWVMSINLINTAAELGQTVAIPVLILHVKTLVLWGRVGSIIHAYLWSVCDSLVGCERFLVATQRVYKNTSCTEMTAATAGCLQILENKISRVFKVFQTL